MEIIGKARELFMKYGIKSVTMDDVSRTLGISKKTLYGEVANKEDLIQKVLELDRCSTEEEMDQLHSQAENAIAHMALIVITLVKKFREVSPVAIYDLQKYYGPLWSEMEAKRTSFVYHHIRENIKRGMNEGIYRKDLHPEIITRLYVEMSRTIVNEQVFPLEKYKRAQLLEQITSYHLNGIVNEKGYKIWEVYKKNIFHEDS